MFAAIEAYAPICDTTVRSTPSVTVLLSCTHRCFVRQLPCL